MMKAYQLRQKSKEELEVLLGERLRRADALRLLIRGKKTKNVKELTSVKKDIARILTITRI